MVDAPNVALIFEGGGMRNSYTAACVDQLIAHNVSFGWVGGISAGATHSANFLSHDRWRATHSFVEFGADPRTGGVRSLLRGTGYFNAEYVFEIAGAPGEELPFDWETFVNEPTPLRIGATRADNGETVYWGREDFKDLKDFMLRMRCSGTLPGLMPTPTIDGVDYVDGALGRSGGLAVDAAMDDGFEKFLILRTRPRGFRRTPPRSPRLIRRLLRSRPAVAEAMLTRYERYNHYAEVIEQLESDGKALVFYPDDMRIQNTERNLQKLKQSFNAGMAQTVREWDSWMEFLQQ